MKNKFIRRMKLKTHISPYRPSGSIKLLIQKINTMSYLWRLEPRSVIRATWLGVAMIFIPIGFKTFITAILSKIFHANYFVAVSISWLRNPLTIIPILYFEHSVGSQIIGSKLPFNIDELSLDLILINWQLIVIPLAIGSIIVTTVVATIIGTLTWFIYYLVNKFSQ